MKRLFTLFLVFWTSAAWGLEPINLARTNPYVAGAVAAGASQSFTYVATTGCTDDGSAPRSCTFQFSSVQAHDLILVFSGTYNDTATSVTLSDGSSTATDLATQRYGASGIAGNISYILDSVATGTVTYTMAHVDKGFASRAFHYRPAITAQVDASVSGNNVYNTNPTVSNNINTAGTPSLVFVGMNIDGSTSTIDQGNINGSTSEHYGEGSYGGAVTAAIQASVVSSPTSGVNGTAAVGAARALVVQIMSFK